jgi:hypothetical protein
MNRGRLSALGLAGLTVFAQASLPARAATYRTCGNTPGGSVTIDVGKGRWALVTATATPNAEAVCAIYDGQQADLIGPKGFSYLLIRTPLGDGFVARLQVAPAWN